MGVEKNERIYIPGAKIPDGDYVRVLMLHKDGTCVDGIGNVFKVIPVPPHGGLIEKNAVFKLIQSMPSVDKLLPVEFMKALQEIPTVIPAEEGE